MARIPALPTLVSLLLLLTSHLASAALSHYGVWKGTAKLFDAARGQAERPIVFGLLSIQDGIDYPAGGGNAQVPPRPQDVFAGIDLKAPYPDNPSVVYWIERNFTLPPPLSEEDFVLEDLGPGFHAVPAATEDAPHRVPPLDMVRDNLVAVEEGRIAVYSGGDGDGTEHDDIIHVLHSFFDPAVEALADVYVWGQRTQNGKGLGLNHIRMNQGHTGELAEESAPFQDGGVIVKYHDHSEALFLACAEQTWPADETDQSIGLILGQGDGGNE